MEMKKKNPKKLFLFALSTVLSFKAYSACGATVDLKKSLKPIYAAQVLLFQCESVSEVDRMLERLKNAGVDTVIVRVFQNRYDRFYKFAQRNHKVGVYFKSRTAPVVDDVLSTVISLSRRHGLKVFAWMTTRQTDWIVEKYPAWLDKRYDFKTGKYITIKKIDLFNKEAQKVLLEMYRDLASYDIDGILFQDDLVYRYTEGYSLSAQKAFESETSLRADPSLFYKKIVQRSGKHYGTEYSPQFWDWVRWKNRSLLKFAETISKAMKQKRPAIKTVLNLYYEAIMDSRNGLAWLAQDFKESLNYDFDYFSVMAYHLQVKKALALTDSEMYSRLETLAARLTEWLDNPARAVIKVQMKDWKSGRMESSENLDKVFKAITQQGKTSLAFIPCEKDTPLETIERYFKKM